MIEAGGGVLNVADEAALNQMMLEWPLLPFSSIEIHPVVDMHIALAQYQPALQTLGGPPQ